MNYLEASNQIAAYRKEIATLREKIRSVQTDHEPQAVENYTFNDLNGQVRMSDLFADKDTLFVVHNMGSSCAYCTLWADGFNGVLAHLENRAAFVVSSPDSPAKQAEFAAARGWSFRMVSHQNSSFAEDMGYKQDGGFWPGVSVFRKVDDQILRLSDAHFGPGDDFAGIWHLFDLLPEGAGGWEPQFSYH